MGKLRYTLILAVFIQAGLAQESNPNPKAAAVISGFATQDTVFTPGEKKFNFGINPVLLFPVGKSGLFLTEWEFNYKFHRENSMLEKESEYELEYLQFNQPFNKNFTGVLGKFLTPGMWNEQLHPAWIKKTPDAPFTSGLLEHNGTGFMLRGAIPLGENANLFYAPFFAAAVDNKYFGSEKMAGGRIGVFFRPQGLSLGFMAVKSLEDERTRTLGGDFTYQLRDYGLDFRGEYFRSHDGSSYWVETAKRFKSVPGVLRNKLELAVRFEQAFASPSGGHEEEGEEYGMERADLILPASMEDDDHDHEKTSEAKKDGHGHGAFPKLNTNRLIGSVNYYIRDGFKVYFSFGRETWPGPNTSQNIWGFGLAFRFLR